MKSGARRDFDAWFSENYDELVRTARALHPQACDLVHHTYLSIIQTLQRGHKIGNLPGYFHTSMWKQSASHFRKLYRITDHPQKILVSDYDIADAIRKEEALIMANHLQWFDRVILTLYLDGWNMAELSRETGINRSTLYESISQSKKKLRHVIRQRTKESR